MTAQPLNPSPNTHQVHFIILRQGSISPGAKHPAPPGTASADPKFAWGEREREGHDSLARFRRSVSSCAEGAAPERGHPKGCPLSGAGGRTRTDTLLPTRDFKSLVSTIPPHRRISFASLIYHLLGHKSSTPKTEAGPIRVPLLFSNIYCLLPNHSIVTNPSGPTVTFIPVSTDSRNSSPSMSTTGIFASVHTSPRMAPEAASESIGLENSMQAGCLL